VRLTISDEDELERIVADELQSPLPDKVCRRRMKLQKVQTRGDICTRGLHSWMQSAPKPSASGAGAGAEWCDWVEPNILDKSYILWNSTVSGVKPHAAVKQLLTRTHLNAAAFPNRFCSRTR